MASANSKVSKVTTTEPGAFGSKRTVDSYYKTEVTTLGDGSLKRETFRTDAKGNNGVKVQEVSVKDGKITGNTISSNATAAERRDLNNSKSQLRNSIRTQTKDAGDVVQKNEADAAAGEITDAGKKNQDVVGGGSGNKANTPPEAGDNSNPSLEQSKKSKPARNKFGKNIVYPLGLGNSKQDVILFSMLQYQPKNVTSSSGQFGFGDRDSNRTSIGSVVLPIPSNIQDTNAVQWGSSTMNPLEIAAGIAALQGISGDMEGVKSTVKNTLGAVQGNKGEIKTAIAGLMAGAAIGKGSDLLARTVGAVINPNMELLFKGPQLRPFTFSFKLSPRSKKEAENVIRIIRFFKQGMSPIKSNSNLFLKSPHTFKIQYKLRGVDGEDHPYIGKIKECGLQSCNVQYTPEGSYATYYDGTMASYQMSLTFSELEPVFNNDYEDDNDQSLGF